MLLHKDRHHETGLWLHSRHQRCFYQRSLRSKWFFKWSLQKLINVHTTHGNLPRIAFCIELSLRRAVSWSWLCRVLEEEGRIVDLHIMSWYKLGMVSRTLSLSSSPSLSSLALSPLLSSLALSPLLSSLSRLVCFFCRRTICISSLVFCISPLPS